MKPIMQSYLECQCQQPGSNSEVCNQRNGQCSCAVNFGGRDCEHCAPGYYNYPECTREYSLI